MANPNAQPSFEQPDLQIVFQKRLSMDIMLTIILPQAYSNSQERYQGWCCSERIK